MSFLLLATIAYAQQAPKLPQLWEKRLAPGVIFDMQWDPTAPRMIYSLRLMTANPAVKATSELAGGTVFENTATVGRGTVTELVKQDSAIAGVNGDFFPFTGDPLGMMLRNGEVLSAPYASTDGKARRATFGWGAGYAETGFCKMNLKVTNGSQTVQAEGFDEQADPGRVTLCTPATGIIKAKTPNKFVIIRTSNSVWVPNEDVEGEVLSTGSNIASDPVQPGTVVLVASGSATPKLNGFTIGDSVKCSLHLDGFNWKKVQNVIGGGPVLVLDGKIDVDWQDERFQDSFTNKRHPRTAIGRTAKGDLVLAAVDGRTAQSVGATLTEMADIMVKLGCVEAINLDGGGSTCMSIFGGPVNRPSDDTERPVANGVVVLGAKPVPSKERLALPAATSLPLGSSTLIKVYDRDKNIVIANSAVLWSCSGNAWIDQGGSLHPITPGIAIVKAMVHGHLLTQTYRISGTVAPKQVKPLNKDD